MEIECICLFPSSAENRFKQNTGLIRFIADRDLSGVYFKNRRYYYQALILSGIFFMTGSYLRYYGRGEMSIHVFIHE